ncbi:MAG: hypothetical protein JRJ85_12185 [Deltaproteobacteria bacterium]|nr:hypothetical protein [Deltaproteobacteria bacterium]
MKKFIVIQDNQVNSFKGKAKRNGKNLNWKEINPISIKTPVNKSILPISILDDPDIIEAFPQLSSLPQVDKKEIELWQWDEEGERIGVL